MRAALLSFVLCCLVADTEPLLEPGSKLEKIVGDCKFTEGPAVDADGNLFFSDNPNDRILKRTPDGKLTVFRQPCGRVNGMTFDAAGRLLVCQSGGAGGKRRVARIEPDGAETVLADQCNGRPFISPNDLTADRRGRIFFTDFGADEKESGVYRIDAPGKVTQVLDNLKRPNGIVLTPDGQTIYVSDRGTQKLHRYRVREDGSLQPDGVVYDFSPDRGIDGMRLDAVGNIWAAAGQGKTTGLFVLSPAGKKLLHHPTPEFATNLAFGGKDRRDVYFTAGGSVYRFRSTRPGAPVGR